MYFFFCFTWCVCWISGYLHAALLCASMTRPVSSVAVTQTSHVYILYVLCLRACEVMQG